MDQPTPRASARAVAPGALFQPGRNCMRVARANRAALLIDGDAYFRAFMKAAERAQRSIIIVGWDFDSRTRLTWEEPPPGVPVLLGDFLNFLARRRRGLHIHVLDWDFPMVFGLDREFPPLYGTGWKRHRRVRMHYDNTHSPAGSHHQKIVVIDDAVAFSGGLDLTWRRWDTCAHGANDPRRVADGKPYAPFHDVMLAVDGEAAKALGAIVRDRWQTATGKKLPSVSVREDPWPEGVEPDFRDVDIAVSRTMPGTETRPEVREVEALFLDMISRAKRSLYIENQYFTSHRVGELLAARLAEPDCPEIVLVSRLLSHGWLAEATMHALRARLVKIMREADRNGRFHVYYPHIPELPDGTCVDVHSKVMCVDDEWLRVGSANLCNRSMGVDTECDLTLAAGGRPEIAGAIHASRNRLIAEHLGVDAARVEEEIGRRGSMSGAIEALRGEGRALLPMDNMPEWSDTVVSMAEISDPERPISIDQLVNEFALDEGTAKPGFPWLKAFAGVLACVGLLALWRYTPLAALASPERIIGWAEDFASRPWAPLAVLAAYTPASFTLFPRPLITLFAVVAFGPWLGAGYALAGILVAATANYFVGSLMGRDTVRRIAGARLNRLSEMLRSKGLLAMTAVRLVPLAPFAVVGLVAGAIRIRLAHFAGGTALGMLPGAMVTTIFGDQLAAGLIDPSRINYALIAVVAAVFVAGVFAVRRWLWKTQLTPHDAAAPAAADVAHAARTAALNRN